MTPPPETSRPGPMGPHTSADPPRDRAGLLVVRAWHEDGAEKSLRARITEIGDLESPEEVIRYAGSREELHAVLDRWLDRLVETNPRGGD